MNNQLSDLIAIQMGNISEENYDLELFDITGKSILKTVLYQGGTIAFFDTKTLYSGNYIVPISNGKSAIDKKIVLVK